MSFRLLGLPEGATYDDITTRFEELAARDAGDAGKVAALEAAKEAILADRLRARLTGELSASYAGTRSVEDIPDETFRERVARFKEDVVDSRMKKILLLPSRQRLFQVLAILVALPIPAWLSAQSAQMLTFICTLSGMGFIYDNGEAPVVRDENGQIGEIRPTQKGPMLAALGITGVLFGAGFFLTKRAVARGVVARSLESALRVSLVSALLVVPSLFLRVRGFFDD